MKRLTAISILCLLCLPLYAVQSLVQSNEGGSAAFSGSFSGSGYSLASSSVGFTSPTTGGDFLLLVYSVNFTYGTPQSVACTATVSTSGFSWSSIFGSAWSDSIGHCGRAGIVFINNASSMNVPTTVTALLGNSGGSVTAANVEFQLYEFSGINSTTYDAFSGITYDSATPAIPAPPVSLTTTATDLVFTVYGGLIGQSNIAAGSGYTLGINSTVANPAQFQYSLNVAPGSYAASFGGASTYWNCIAMAFKGSGGTPTPVPRHRGFVN